MRHLFAFEAALIIALAGMPAGASAAGEKVTIASQNGRLQLDGYWFPARESSPRPAIVSLHGCNGALDDKGALNPCVGP